ncbi:MAG: SRPBCC domain-containing protein [Rhizobiales bacterium]|nr:SRPBCC domain-containing protein [Hyphomicrobiales bacterium]
MNHDDPSDEVRFETELDAPPEKVWRALTVPEFVARWLMPNDIRPEEGRAFSLKDEDGAIECEIVEAKPPQLLGYSWREEGGPDSLVRFHLAGTKAGGTRLTVVHSGLARPALPTLRVAGVSCTRMSLGAKRSGPLMIAANTFALAA